MTARAEEDMKGRPRILPLRKYPELEITKDPIYLLERRRVIPTAHGLEWNSDRECLMYGEDEATDEYLLEREMAVVAWEVYYSAGVWFTRAEAETWAHAHAYRFESRNEWRVFCCCAAGELRGLLEAYTELEP